MEFLAAVLRADGKQMLSLGGEWPRVESLCRDHQLLGKCHQRWLVRSRSTGPPAGAARGVSNLADATAVSARIHP